MQSAPTPAAPADELTVNELIRRFPETISIFNSFGIDSCCGGAVPVREAALRDGANADALFAALDGVVRGTR